MKEEVHVEKTEENPVVSRVLKDVHERHRIVAKTMDQNGFKFSLNIVKEDHENSKLLIECVN